ncbi:hypothetical protein N136_00403 [Leifsonia aquatica ATCC 14665]|uniref:Uncharacterized protein n=1 Tax=Leifsonia aquatica ATCC 14665 TaxID=1358026 RepID=U2RWR3_LEIAQ|nr:hypothetical protein N136_00403 [Leifsonia aquatica ATCC 14665]
MLTSGLFPFAVVGFGRLAVLDEHCQLGLQGSLCLLLFSQLVRCSTAGSDGVLQCLFGSAAKIRQSGLGGIGLAGK